MTRFVLTAVQVTASVPILRPNPYFPYFRWNVLSLLLARTRLAQDDRGKHFLIRAKKAKSG